MANSIWVEDTLTGGLKAFPDWYSEAVTVVVERQAGKAETYMRQNAPWKDHTSNARNGLRAFTNHEAKRHSLILSHGMPYGIWLETRFAGRYAIIVPSLTIQGKEIMSTLKNLLERL